MKKLVLVIMLLFLSGVFVLSCSDNVSDNNGSNVSDVNPAGIWWGFFPINEDIPPSDWDSFEWDFGDDSALSSEESPTHKYQHPGVYVVRLSVIDGVERTGNGFETIEVGNAQIVPEITSIEIKEGVERIPLNPEEDIIPVGEEVYFEGSCPFPLCEWNFGDGTAGATGETVSHVFDEAGLYLVTIKGEDANGTVGTGTIRYSDGELLLLNVGLNITYAGVEIDKTDTGSGDEFDFSIGDGLRQIFVAGVISEEGEARFVGDYGRQYRGTVSTNGLILSGTFDKIDWDRNGAYYSTVTPIGIELNGGIFIGISGYYEDGGEKVVQLLLDDSNAEEHEVAELEGDWIIEDAFETGNTLKISIENDGTFTATDTNTNTFTDGTINVLTDPGDTEIYDIFEVSLAFGSEVLTGLATYLDEDSIITDKDVLVLGLTSEDNSYSLSGFATREVPD